MSGIDSPEIRLDLDELLIPRHSATGEALGTNARIYILMRRFAEHLDAKTCQHCKHHLGISVCPKCGGKL